MKKLLAATVLGAMLMYPVCVQATEADINGNAVVLSLENIGTDETMLVVVRAGGDINNNDDIYAVKLVSKDKQGKLTVGFNMPDLRISVPQRYDIYTRNNQLAEKQGSFAYSTQSMRTTFLTNLNDAINSQSRLTALIDPDNPSASGVASVYTKDEAEILMESIGADAASFYALTDAQRVSAAAMLVNSADGSFADTESAAAAINCSIAVTVINSSQNAGNVLNKCGLVFEGEKYSEIADSSKKAWLDNYLNTNKGYANNRDFVNAYETANRLYKINNTRFDSMETVLAGYAGNLGLTVMPGYRAYMALSSKVTANERIAAALKLTPAQSAAALDAVIQKSIEGNAQTPASGSGGGGGGTGTVGKTGMIPVPTPALDTAEQKTGFKDMGSAEWARQAVESMTAAGIISGDGDGNFRPNDTVTREEYVKMIVCAANMYDSAAKCNFTDVPEDAWYRSYIASGFNRGLVFGKSETEFGVGTPLTRQDMVVIAARAAEKIKTPEPIREYTAFEDDDEISEYAKAYVEKLCRAGVVNGIDSKNFDPFGYATRAQGALIIYKLFLN